MIRIAHIITGLTTGGAENMLYKLLGAMNRTRFEPVVISLMDKGELGPRIESLGIPVYALGSSQGRASLSALWRLLSLVRSSRPDLIQGWMYHGNIAAFIARIFVTNHPPVLWNIRQTLYAIENEKLLTRVIIRASRYLSGKVDKIIYNSTVSAQQHETIGFQKDRRVLLPNGFDVEKFRPSKHAREIVRQSLGLAEDAPIVGLFARYHPMKDHANFMRAAGIVYLQRPDVHFVLAGQEMNLSNPVIREYVDASAAKDNIHLLGERNDVPELMAATDVAVTSSAWGEGFPNALGEAMACGIPCVVTDVGDSARILGAHGKVVPAREPHALGAAILGLLNMDKGEQSKLGMYARQRVVDEFSIARIAGQYESLYEQIYGSNA